MMWTVLPMLAGGLVGWLLVVGVKLCSRILRVTVQRFRFRWLRREVLGGWRMLRDVEREEFLYAFHGFLLRKEYEAIDRIRASRTFDRIEKGFLVETRRYRVQDLVENCPNYRDMNDSEMTMRFRAFLDDRWRLMRALDEFDVRRLAAEIEFVFSERRQLANGLTFASRRRERTRDAW